MNVNLHMKEGKKEREVILIDIEIVYDNFFILYYLL